MTTSSNLHLGSCSLVLPMWEPWKLALTVHLTQSILGFGLVGFILYKTLSSKPKQGSRSTTSTKYIGIFFAITLCAAVPIFSIILSRAYAVNWMVNFLLSFFGACVFFKALTVAYGNYPEGADRDLKTWMLWFSSLPEPVFVKGNLQPAPNTGWLLGMALLKTAGCSILVSILKVEHYPFRATWSSGDSLLLDSLLYLLDSYLHLWWLFLFCAFCQDVGVAMVAIQGFKAEEPYSSPLFLSRSYKECWGERWNRPYHLFFKRTVYLPSRRAGCRKFTASLFAFLASGLVHEYNFFIHNHVAYVPGQALQFFFVAGILMALEEVLPNVLFSDRMLGSIQKVPSSVICFLLIIPVLPFFEKLFFQSWLEAGMIEDVSTMLPHVEC